MVRAVQNLHEEGFGIAVLVTDRQSQISKWVKENLPCITDHHYDIWHVDKVSLQKMFGIFVKRKHLARRKTLKL